MGARKIIVAMPKGGAGKTATAVAFARGLERAGKSVRARQSVRGEELPDRRPGTRGRGWCGGERRWRPGEGSHRRWDPGPRARVRGGPGPLGRAPLWGRRRRRPELPQGTGHRGGNRAPVPPRVRATRVARPRRRAPGAGLRGSGSHPGGAPLRGKQRPLGPRPVPGEGHLPLPEGSRDVVGFGARLLTAGGDGAEHPKYLNSPETPLFRKGQLLFGLSESRAAIRIARRAVLVEGYFDTLALAQVGLREVVASGRTAVTASQLSLLQRSGAEELVVLFDTDLPGLEAPARIAPALLGAGLSTRIARLPGAATDPDAFVRSHGLRGLEGVIAFAVPLTEWLLERAIAGRVTGESKALSVEQKLLIVRDLGPFVAASRPGLPRALFEQRIARRLELYIVALRAELARFHGARVQREVPREGAGAA